MQLQFSDRTAVDLTTLSVAELRRLQWDVERHYATLIKSAARGTERSCVTRRAYEAVAGIVLAIRDREGTASSFGLQTRDVGLVLTLLGADPASFFELGFGTGRMMEAVARSGHSIAGVEVTDVLVDRLGERLPSHRHRLFATEFLSLDTRDLAESVDLAYWNDVFEHVHPDEIEDYLRHLHNLIRPGGLLVTVTPNWHVRPSDITRMFRPPRSTAEGLHLKEYTLRELVDVHERAGFTRPRVPLVCTRNRSILLGDGFVALKRAVEPWLEHLPIRAARIAAGGLGYYCLMVRKS